MIELLQGYRDEAIKHAINAQRLATPGEPNNRAASAALVSAGAALVVAIDGAIHCERYDRCRNTEQLLEQLKQEFAELKVEHDSLKRATAD